MKRIGGLPGLFFLGIVLLFVVPSAVEFYTDWLWFREIGYEAIFLRKLNSQALVFAVAFAIVFGFLYLNLRLARRRLNRPHIVLGTGADGRAITVEGRQLSGLALPAAAVVALAIALSSASHWLTWLSYFNHVPFGEADALFNRDASFYVFRLPIYQLIRQQALAISILALVGCGIYYVLSGSFVIEQRYGAAFWPRIRLIPAARRHLSVLGALVFALLAWGAWQDMPQTLLTEAAAPVNFGASFSDVNARLPFLWVSLAAFVLGAVLVLWSGTAVRDWPVPLAIALAIGAPIAGGIYGAFLQRVVVKPNEQERELPYMVNNIAATRRAYALDRVEERELSGEAGLDANTIVRNADTIENIRLWDHQVLLQTFAQIQEIRTYYEFPSVDNDRYAIDGKYRQVMLSVRELSSESLQNRSWINEHLSYTHGYGLTVGPVNQVTTEGLPVLFIRDLPPVSTKPDLRIDEPSIYYGELTRNYVLVRSRQPEFHYPRGDDNETTIYNGAGGVPIGGFLRRLLFAVRFRSTDILFTSQITPESRIMFHRQIGDRVKLIAPFLDFDADPYPIISNGRVYWMQDAYTTSANYPYSTPFPSRALGTINYIRNSVKVVIDAYDGTVTFYLAEPGDPLALTLSNVFPGTFRPMSEMPADLRAHVRYPEEIFKIQSNIYATYHMADPDVFYNKEDQWQVPTLDTERQAVMQPYYTIMRLPGGTESEFIQMLPFTPRLKDNLAAWMVARSDGEQYGRLLVFKFPKQKIVYGPRQIVGRINQNQDISPQITLWNQQGSQVIWGTLLVIPIEESLLYIRPLYLRSADGRIPELKRVIVAYQERIVMQETLVQALAEIFGRQLLKALAPDRLASSATSVVFTEPEEFEPPAGMPGMPPNTTKPVVPLAAEGDLAAMAAEAEAHFQRAEAALKQGNLVLYAEETQKAREIIRKMVTKK